MTLVEILLAVVFAVCTLFLIWKFAGALRYILRHPDEVEDNDSEKQNNLNEK